MTVDLPRRTHTPLRDRTRKECSNVRSGATVRRGEARRIHRIAFFLSVVPLRSNPFLPNPGFFWRGGEDWSARPQCRKLHRVKKRCAEHCSAHGGAFFRTSRAMPGAPNTRPATCRCLPAASFSLFPSVNQFWFPGSPHPIKGPGKLHLFCTFSAPFLHFTPVQFRPAAKTRASSCQPRASRSGWWVRASARFAAPRHKESP